jgi:hypothetical protein
MTVPSLSGDRILTPLLHSLVDVVVRAYLLF